MLFQLWGIPFQLQCNIHNRSNRNFNSSKVLVHNTHLLARFRIILFKLLKQKKIMYYFQEIQLLNFAKNLAKTCKTTTTTIVDKYLSKNITKLAQINQDITL